MNIFQLSRNVKAINVQDVAIDSIQDTKETIADLNAEQMIKGLRSDGSEITPSYSSFTVQIKQSKGQITDHVTLRDTGAFQAAISTDVEGLNITTGSRDPKSAKLEKKYSKAKGSIFGLSEKFKAEYIREDLRPTYTERIKDLIFKK